MQFYDFGDALIQAKNKKNAGRLYYRLKNRDTDFLEVVSEQRAITKLSASWCDDQQVGFNEARRLIDQNRERVLVYRE